MALVRRCLLALDAALASFTLLAVRPGSVVLLGCLGSASVSGLPPAELPAHGTSAGPNLSTGPLWDTLSGGDVSERPKELASKASVVQATVGSNPTVTAAAPGKAGGLILLSAQLPTAAHETPGPPVTRRNVSWLPGASCR